MDENGCSWEGAYLLNGVCGDDNSTLDPDEVSKDIEDIIREFEADLEETQPKAVFYRIFNTKRLVTALRKISLDDFGKLESGEYGTSPGFRDAVKNILKKELPVALPYQPKDTMYVLDTEKELYDDNFKQKKLS